MGFKNNCLKNMTIFVRKTSTVRSYSSERAGLILATLLKEDSIT